MGFIDPTDQHHEKSLNISGYLDRCDIIIPWPCLYESLSTHTTRNKSQLFTLKEIINRPNIIRFDESPYKDNALQEVFELNKFYGYSFNLTDCLILEILKDTTIKIDYLITYDTEFERNFAPIFQARGIKIISE